LRNLTLQLLLRAYRFHRRGLLRERHAFGTCIKGDHRDGRLSRHAAMKRVNHLGHHLQPGRGSMPTPNKHCFAPAIGS
jgi:hypothetical protein